METLQQRIDAGFGWPPMPEIPPPPPPRPAVPVPSADGAETVVFIDGPDPDNFVLAVGAALTRGCDKVVLTGRPANLNVKSRPFDPATCARGPTERDVFGDADVVKQAVAAHLKRFAAAHGVALTIYDGGVATHAPVAHAEHVHEFFFGRPDLAGFDPGDFDTDFPLKADDGVLAHDAYAKLVAAVDAAGPYRGDRVRAYLRVDRCDLAPLDELPKACAGPVNALVGGPFSALALLARMDPEFAERLASVHAMAGAWDPAAANLFANQFNCGADPGAAVRVLGADSPLRCPVTLYPTEFCRAGLSLTPAEVRAASSPRVAALYDLWDALAGGRGSVTIFDAAALLAGVAIPTVPVVCALGDDDVFRLEETDESRVRAAARDPPAAAVEAARSALLTVLGALQAAAAPEVVRADWRPPVVVGEA